MGHKQLRLHQLKAHTDTSCFRWVIGMRGVNCVSLLRSDMYATTRLVRAQPPSTQAPVWNYNKCHHNSSTKMSSIVMIKSHTTSVSSQLFEKPIVGASAESWFSVSLRGLYIYTGTPYFFYFHQLTPTVAPMAHLADLTKWGWIFPHSPFSKADFTPYQANSLATARCRAI